MKRMDRFAGFALFLSAAMLPCVAQSHIPANGAESNFNGTWKIDAAQTRISPKPQTFYIGGGWYHCVSCTPQFAVKADGTDQAVRDQAFDMLNVRGVDDQTIQLIGKKDGKVIFEQTRTVSKDGKALTVKTKSYPKDGGAPVMTETTAKRTGLAPAGVHGTSGDWQILNFSQSSNGLTFSYKVNGDEISMSDPNGASYTAKLDGSDAPVKGEYGYDTVSLKKVGPDSIEETDKRAEKVVDVSKITVHGKTMTIEDTSKPSERTSTFTAHKVG
jgi:hypothetical protein